MYGQMNTFPYPVVLVDGEKTNLVVSCIVSAAMTSPRFCAPSVGKTRNLHCLALHRFFRPDGCCSTTVGGSVVFVLLDLGVLVVRPPPIWIVSIVGP